jgi:putative phosphoesterase
VTRGADDAGAGRPTVVGVLSDTHGMLPDDAFAALARVHAIVHAGDVCDEVTLPLLATIAPVTAVRGNCDTSGSPARLPAVANVAIGGVRFLIGHRLGDLVREVPPERAGARVVVSGHSHRASVRERGGVTYVNPGSASEARGGVRSVAIVTVEADGAVSARVVELG